MFIGERLVEQTRGKSILLANPPFGTFEPNELAGYAKAGTPILVNNKAAELLRRTLRSYSRGVCSELSFPRHSCMGRLPRTCGVILSSISSLREVSLFPDKVFSFSGAESAVVLGRRLPDESRKSTVLRFRRIRERQMPMFRETYDAPSSRTVEQSRFNADVHWDMRVPDLEGVWLALASNPTSSDRAELMQGLVYNQKDLPRGTQTYSGERFPGAHQGFIRLERGLQIHRVPNCTG